MNCHTTAPPPEGKAREGEEGEDSPPLPLLAQEEDREDREEGEAGEEAGTEDEGGEGVPHTATGTPQTLQPPQTRRPRRTPIAVAVFDFDKTLAVCECGKRALDDAVNRVYGGTNTHTSDLRGGGAYLPVVACVCLCVCVSVCLCVCVTMKVVVHHIY